MSLRKRLFAVIIVICLFTAEWFAGGRATLQHKENTLQSSFAAKDTLYFWYTDEALTDYLSSVALEYYEKTGYRIVPTLHSGLEYLEEINQESLHGEKMPDMFITTNDTLEKAYLAGLASPVWDKKNVCNENIFPKAALDAVSYRDNIAGYPFYYETSVLLFNKTYMQNVAKDLIESEADMQAAKQAAEILEDGGQSEEAVQAADAVEVEVLEGKELLEAAEEKIDEVIPGTMEDILSFADGYDAPAEVEAVFKWDVSDIFYNYFFVGNYMIVGGDTGDTTENIDIDNQETRDCLQVYQDLNQFFSIDTKTADYHSILQEFIDGKIVFTVATTDAIAKIEEARAEGKFSYEYGVARIPDLSESLKSRSLSVTNAVVVNGYSEKKEIANDFAKYLTVDKADGLYAKTGKAASKLNIAYENEKVSECMNEYAESIPMPKMWETSNLWVQLEICFTKIWTGADIGEQLSGLAEQINSQLRH